MRLEDGVHWNATAQQLCGELLAEKLYELDYGDKKFCHSNKNLVKTISNEFIGSKIRR
jgi:hypothetical protein